MNAKLKDWVHKLCEKYTFLDENAMQEFIVVFEILIIAIFFSLFMYILSN